MELKETAAVEIGRKLDEFATELVIGSAASADPDRWAESLTALAAFARSSGRPEIANMAEAAVGRMRANSGTASNDKVRAALTEDIERLREAVDHPLPAEEDAPAISLADDPELIQDFVLESREHLESIESQVLTLERDSNNMEAVHSVFRSFHTIKGLAGFLGFDVIQNLTHEVETVLDLARNSKLSVTAAVIDIVLESKDYVSKWLVCIEASASGPMPPTPAPEDALLARIHRFIEFGDAATITEEAPVEAASPNVATPWTPETKVATRSVKVDTDKLDFLVDMVGEMVIAQSLVRHDPSLKLEGNGPLARNLSQLARITDEVQRTAMAMRMVPVGPLFQKMVRLVRDLSRKFGKQARVQTDGEDVELDRNIVEELADPLMHMIRNSLDHGIEPPDQRAASGKDPVALIMLRAFHRSGHIVIEVSDDGRGINKKKVIERAQKNGLIGPAAQLTDAECHNLIFQPGFSTADKVSDVSGRGVGMDVVRKQVQKLRGTVELQSIEGAGTTFSLKLPLTLAIIDGLVVTCGPERYILPLASVKELFRPTPGQVSTIEGRAEVVSVRDRLVPVLRLYDRFKIEPKSRDPLSSVFVMAETDSATFCIMVDDLAGKQEVVIKNLGSVFRKVPGVSGGAILGDGRVGLILDLETLFAGNRDAH